MQRGQIIPKDRDIPHKKFLVRVYVGRDDTGKRKYHSETVTGTISQAKSKLNEMLGGIATGSFVAPSKLTLSAYLDQYLSNKRDIEDCTANAYRHWMNTCVIPVLGNVKLGKLTKLQIQKLYGSLSSDHEYSKRTIQYVHSILRQALATAISDRILAHNPCDGAQSSIPKFDLKKKNMVCYTFEETREIFEKTAKDRWAALWRLLLTTGMRQQEALALKWPDIEKVSGQTHATVNRTLKRDGDGNYRPRDFAAKNASSRRQITLSDETAAVLQEHRKRQLEEILKAGPSMKREGWVFATRTGSFLDPRTIRRTWQQSLAKHGLKVSRLHDTRHTHLTHLLSSGVNPKAVAARSGHSNPTVLLSTYAHVLPEVAIDAANIVERRLAENGNAERRFTNAGRPDMGSAEVGTPKGVRGVGIA